MLLLILQERLLDSCVFFLLFRKLHDFLCPLKSGLLLLHYPLIEFIFFDLLLNHVVSLFAGLLDSLDSFRFFFLQKCNSIVKFDNILLLFQTHPPSFLPGTEVAWCETLGLGSESLMLEIGLGSLVFSIAGVLIVVLRRTLVEFVDIPVIHRVYCNVKIGGLIISVFVGFNIV